MMVIIVFYDDIITIDDDYNDGNDSVYDDIIIVKIKWAYCSY